jgi:predicted peroxiredoxin
MNKLKKVEKDKNLEQLIEAVKKRGVKCQICGYIPKYKEEFQLTLVNDKLTCIKCEKK